MSEEIAARWALITGATRGIGRAVAELLATQGIHLVLSARTSADLEELHKALKKRRKDLRVETVAADLSRREGVDRLLHHVQSKSLVPDILVNNAGAFATGGIMEEPDGRLEKMMGLNLFCPYYLVRGFAPAMAARGRGHIFNMCSIASRKGFADRGAYVISKHALLGLSRALRSELQESGVRVTALLPGPVRTDSWSAAELEDEQQLIPPGDVALVLWAAYQTSNATDVEEIVLQPQHRWL